MTMRLAQIVLQRRSCPLPAVSHAVLSRMVMRRHSLSTTPFYGAPRPPLEEEATTLKRVAVAVHSATTAFSDPTRADAVAALGEVTGFVALRGIRDRMMSDPTGRRILVHRPVVNTSNESIEKLLSSSQKESPNHVTFGQAYASFMKQHGFDPNDRSQVRYVSDPDLAYIMLRYRQCHDYWHTLTGLPPTVLGELGLKWLELLQTGLPVAALSATVGSLRLDEEERHILSNHYLPWAVRMSQQAAYLLNVYYEEEFDTKLHALRERLRIEEAPQM